MKGICQEKGDTRDSCLPPKPWADENPHMDRSVKLSELKNGHKRHKISIQFFCDSSGAQLEEEKKSQILEGTFYLETGSGLQPKLLGQSHPLTCLIDSRSSPIHQQTWNIRQEVDRLMQDHNTGSSQPSSRDPKADKNPVSPTVSIYGGEATVYCSLQSINLNSSIYDIYSQCKGLKAGK